ncbi:acyl-CoA thioester hydrolase [Murinocardiopsis flavida]|uniref:Acyl-CoA thioester hydrolase n=1 Tax=Murinocardiopsis flavida TaxID=645275 RepID=A0A2P8DRQ1_9ACTN|nr:thioesterase family protein [Murinocardiopsis flavida]PSK99890.1 acyl-CoA thioester hydrolase [Murinocardiopsis flavida]
MTAADADPGSGPGAGPDRDSDRDPATAPATDPVYPHWTEIPTRWADNDVYGHVNNTVHYAFMDTAINTWLVERGGLDFRDGPVVGLCVESSCVYTAEFAFPDVLAAGIRVGHLGNSSVRYEIGLYRSDRSTLVAEGRFAHVFCDRRTRRPVRIDGKLRAALEELRRKP